MIWRPKGWILIGMLLTVMSTAGRAQMATTQVADTVYHADGTTATGTVVISWPAFTTSAGDAVAGGSTSATIAAGGALSVRLTPNSGAIPVGTYYTVVFHLDDGSVTREYWVVPASATAVKIGAIESTVLPTTVAMQTVTKNYVDTAIAAAVAGHPVSGTPYVVKSGDTMTGPLNLAGDPTSGTQAADKNYVDASVAGVTSGLGQKVSTVPGGTQVVSQPVGTELDVNRLNGVAYASQYATFHGTNGIQNAITGPDCASGCDVKVERTYTPNEGYWTGGLSSGTHITDARGGAQVDSFLNPMGANNAGLSTAEKIDAMSTVSALQLVQQTGTSTPASVGLTVNHMALGGGSNLLPGSIEAPPYFKMAYSAATVSGTYNAQGQHGLMPEAITCYGVGDCLLGSRYINASGGSRDEADEGAHLYDTIVQEDARVFQGVCLTGCTTGSTSVNVRQDVAPGTQGEGRFLIDKNPAKTYSSATTGGMIVAGTFQTPHASVQFSGTNFPVSVFLSTAQTIASQGNNMAPGTVSVPVATTGVPNGFVTNTGGLASSGIACVVDRMGGYYEMAPFTVVDGTHLQMTLNKPHAAGATIAVGGLCGYGVEQVADTANGIRQVFPVVGSYSPTALYYESLASAVLGQMNQTDAFLNINMGISSLTRSGGVVTAVTPGPLPYDVNGLTVTIAGASDSSFNGSFQVTTTGANSFTYAQGGADGTASGGSIQYLNGGFVVYPMAEVLSVYNSAGRSIDGTMTLAPNTVAWAANDPVEQPHWFQEDIWADVDLYQQTVPRPGIYTRAGIMYGGNNSGSMFGWSIQNITPQTNYFGYGGTHTTPIAAYEAQGVWQHTMNVTAGEQSVFTVYCNLHGCGNWNSGYDLFQLQDAAGFGVMHYAPQTSTLSLNLRGGSFQFSPSGLTASAINAASVNTGKLPTSVLPIFGASGAAHAVGAVPDPGGTQGSTRFLREDGSWAVPAGGGGGSGGGCSSACTFTGQTTLDTAGGGVALSMTGSNTNGTVFLLGGTGAGVHNWGFQSDPNGHWLVGDFSTGNYGFEAQIASGGAGFLAVNNNTALGWMANSVTTNGATPDTAFTRTAAGAVALGNGAAGDASGSLAAGSLAAAIYKGPATAPTGACSVVGWAFSQDGHASFCNGSSWQLKI